MQASKSSRHKNPFILSSPIRSKGRDFSLKRDESEALYWEQQTDLSHSVSRPIPVPTQIHRRSKSFLEAKVSPSYNTPDMVQDLDQNSTNMVRI